MERNMFFFDVIDIIISLFGLKFEDLIKRPATKEELLKFLMSQEMYDDSGDPDEKDVYVYENKDFKAIADEFCTLVIKSAKVNHAPSKVITKAWTPLINDWDTEMATKAIAKSFNFEPAVVPEKRLEALKDEIIKEDPSAAVTFGCCNDSSYNIFKEDYSTLMSSNGDIMIVFDDCTIILS